jgi:hypothetical protein
MFHVIFSKKAKQKTRGKTIIKRTNSGASKKEILLEKGIVA